MKSRPYRPLLIATAGALPVLAHAHPGHDGDHDLVWDFGHLIDNPLATIACISLVMAAGWGVSRFLRGRPAPKSQPVKRR